MPERSCVRWQPHPTYEGYEVSDEGAVRSVDRYVANRWGKHLRTGRELKTFLRVGGYMGGNISVEGQRINFEVHRFVCESFHGPSPAPGSQVRHLNGDRLDNRASNLAWGTAVDNMADKIKHGRNHEVNKTHCPRGHAYDAANTYRSPSAPRKRNCRACMVIHEARRPSRRKVVVPSGCRT